MYFPQPFFICDASVTQDAAQVPVFVQVGSVSRATKRTNHSSFIVTVAERCIRPNILARAECQPLFCAVTYLFAIWQFRRERDFAAYANCLDSRAKRFVIAEAPESGVGRFVDDG
jgi:hypothetical protein